MRVRLKAYGSLKPPDSLEIDSGRNVGCLKKMLSQSLENPSVLQNHDLVCGGMVLSDDSLQLSCLELNESTVCLLPRSTFILEDQKQVYNWIRKIVDLQVHFEPSEEQGDGNMVKLFKLFVESLNDEDAVNLWKPSDFDLQELNSVVDVLENNSLSSKVQSVTWFGEYGCALLSTVANVDDVKLNLICLDQWTFSMRSGPSGRKHSAHAGNHSSVAILVGTIPLRIFPDFLDRTSFLLQRAKSRKGEKRTAAGNEQGHQKTPAMIQAIMLDALGNSTNKSTSPRGGFTDVGLHTGGQKRNTSWPLLLAVIQTILESRGREVLYRECVPQLYLRMAESAVAHLSKGSRSWKGRNVPNRQEFRMKIDSVMQVLQVAGQEAIALAELFQPGYDVAAFEVRCVRVRFELENANRKRASLISEAYDLAPFTKGDLDLRNIGLSVPDETQEKSSLEGLRTALGTETENLGSFPAPLPIDSSWNQIAEWLQEDCFQSPKSDAAKLQACTAVETYFYNKIRFELKPATIEDIEIIDTTVDKYRLISSSLRNSKAASAREVLVVWCAFCIVHITAKDIEPLLQKVSIALDAENLGHLVLSDKLSVEAVIQVAKYINKNAGMPSCIFSLRKHDQTIEFARAHAQKSAETQEVWSTEQEKAKERQEIHWKKFCDKQARLRILDEELDKLESERCLWQSKVDGTEPITRYTTPENDKRRKEAEAEVRHYNSEVSMTRNTIHQTEVPPPPVMQPLPSKDENAMPILFFLHMPPIFQVLSRLSFSAQQMMLPSGDKVELAKPVFSSRRVYNIVEAVSERPPVTEWYSYYMSESTERSYSAVKTRVILGSPLRTVQGKWYPSNVREYSSPDAGVWYPDSLVPKLYWNGGGFGPDARRGLFFNPSVSLGNDVLVSKFTEKLPEEDISFQWALEQHGRSTSSDRGNWAEAAQDEQPSWVSGKEEYFALGALRAYPRQQIRKLCVALRERSFSLQHSSVRTILRQTLYHLGELSKEEGRPYWRTDLFDSDGWKALNHVLNDLAEELRFRSRDHGAILTLGEIAAYASQWYPESSQTARQFAVAVRKWADELAPEEEIADAQQVASIRAKRSLFYMYGMVCYNMEVLSNEDVSQLVQLLFLSDYNRLFEDPSPHEAAVRSLTSVTLPLMARRLPEVLRIVDSNPKILTSAVQLVLEATPNNLDWKRIARSGQKFAAYRAVSGDGHLFSVNLLTGVILFDGMPPRRLPKSITNSPLYRRTFSDRNFEVVRKKPGLFQTVRRVQNRFYEFHKDNITDSLTVREFYSQQEKKLELLDGTERQIEVWGSMLPIRLKRMHSHWISRAQKVILLRPRLFSERTVHYIITHWEAPNAEIQAGGTDSDESKDWVCYRVPEHRIGEKWDVLTQLIYTFDRLVLPKTLDATVVKVLQKFETDGGLIHALLRPDGSLIFEIPRFNLVFELSEEGILLSRSFQSFRLKRKQQLEDILHDFDQYLLLESGNQLKVLIPAGVIELNEEKVFVSGPQDCDATRTMHVYNVHERFLSVDAAKGNLSVEARLQLAAVFASCGSMVPEGSLLLTGCEMAIDLLRQSWVNRPLTPTELTHIVTSSEVGVACPAVPLLCHCLDISSRALGFLYPKNKSNEILPLNCSAATEYLHLKQGQRLNPRATLTADEEIEILGRHVHAKGPSRASSSSKTIEVSSSESKSGFVSRVEGHLTAMITCDASKKRQPVPFPISGNELTNTVLGAEMIIELRRSWQMYHELPRILLNTDPIEVAAEGENLLHVCRSTRSELEKLIICVLSKVPDAIGCHKNCFIIRRTANLEANVNLRDLADLACHPEKIHVFSPFLSCNAMRRVHASILKWLEICVMEDKMTRICALSRSGNVRQLTRELLETGRKWDVAKNPEWLVFEVEQQIQIRGVQYSVAKFCAENPGAITQLNMGEGKTRVILPMLLLQLADSRRLVRLHFLSPLLNESYDFLHHTITASILCRRLYLLPFHRDLKLSPREAGIMLLCLKGCQKSQGAICLVPEHRLSLHLKWHELGLSGDETSKKVRSRLESISKLPYFDIFDESDEILHHKYQLIYAVGSCIPLPAGKERWVAAAAALKQIQCNP